ncbi:MAG TPA: ligand-gated channel protein, partial [Allosphingosinicella sp.]|nr:ligand-gated channel protein [Allosphingosinicella sp.]
MLVLAGMHAAPARADDVEPNLIVVTGERAVAADSIERTAGGADLVDAEDYEDRVAVSLRDALAFSPGVYA